MPKQYVLFGRPVPHLASQRISCLLASLAVFAVVSLLFTVPTAIPAGPSLSLADHKFSIPKSLKGSWGSLVHPFKPPSHAPPRQNNDTYGESSWYANWKWLSIPFSSSVTLDENRALLPPLKPRPAIYCYYDSTVKKEAADRNADSALLLTWRRAWWAQGFKPVILSAAEAMNNPLYEELQTKKEVDPGLRTDLMRWLAWENMGGGLLADYLLFPMDARDEPLLVFLRRGEFPKLTMWKGLGDGLFAGPKPDVAAALKLALASPSMKTATSVAGALAIDRAGDPIVVDDAPKSLAHYDASAIEKRYAKVGETLNKSRLEGLKMLNALVTAHLHVTWQNLFPSGIAVLKPMPRHMTHMIAPAYELAQRLAHCPPSPLPSSCPPNHPRCSPCVSSTPVRVTTPSRYRNTSGLFTLGTVPHPYTTASLTRLRERIDVAWIRRDSPRDAWLAEATKELLGSGVSGGPRVLRLKEAIASDVAAWRSLWFSAEREPPIPDDVDWRFGFAIPAVGAWASDGKSETPVPGPERRPPPPPADPADGPLPDPDTLRFEPDLLTRARRVALARDRRDGPLREAVEAWNLADTEAWRFTRAYVARARVERLKWEEEEARYAGGAGSEKGRRSGWTASFERG